MTFSSNLQINGIKTLSDAIYSFLIDDQILSINGKVPNNPQQLIDMAKEIAATTVNITVNRQCNKSPGRNILIY